MDIAQNPYSDLPREAFAEIMLILHGALPPPMEGGEARRDRAALAAVASLAPVNAAEGRLAAQFVTADAWAMDCLRLAVERRREMEIARKCRAQAMSLMRESKSALRLLLKLQAQRQAREKDAAAASDAAWAEHGTAQMMQAALSDAAAADAGREPDDGMQSGKRCFETDVGFGPPGAVLACGSAGEEGERGSSLPERTPPLRFATASLADGR